jgi:two-component system chemotaxis response regulator CheY
MKPLSIFLVDDEPHVRLYMRTVLCDCPVEIVAEGANGQEAVEGYEQIRPDIVLMDISMPRMTGLEAMRKILESHPDARIVLLTSISDQRSIREALGEGATHYLRKDTPVESIKQSMLDIIADVAAEADKAAERNHANEV